MLHSVRFRATLMALVAMGVVLTVAAVILVVVVRSTMVAEIDTSIANRALDIAVEIEVTNFVENAAFPNDEQTFAGVIEFYSDLLAEEGSADEELLLANLRVHNDEAPDAVEILRQLGVAAAGPSGYDRASIPVDEPVNASVDSITLTQGADNLRMIAADVIGGDELVIVARTLDGVDRTVAPIRRGALFVVPLLTAIVGLLVWMLTGRALRPVEAIRREAEMISSTDLSRRVSAGEGRDEIARLGLTFNEMLGRIDTGQERQRRFAADAAHELRSPLASMQALLDVDLAHPETVDWERSVDRLSAETSRMQRLVEDLLVMTRVEVDTTANHTLVDMDDLVLSEVASQRNTSCSIDASAVSACTVRGNAVQLRRVVNNLISNAVRHAESVVTVSCSSSESGAQVVVSDDGAGIPRADRERIFERFERLDEARSRDAGGTGLGLALAREVTLAHGGTLAVDTGPAGGARFTVALPAS